MILADHFDLTHLANAPEKGKRPTPYPRPFELDDKERTRMGKTKRHPDEVRALLARRGPRASTPSKRTQARDPKTGRFIKQE